MLVFALLAVAIFEASADGLYGDAGDDELAGGEGNDFLTGSDGSDTFRVGEFAAADADVIADFQAGATSGDVIAWTDGFTTFNDVMTAATQVGSDTVIRFGGETILTLQNVVKVELAAENFNFH